MIRLQDENRAELAKRALALLTAAQAPLTPDAMCHASGLARVLNYNKRPSKLILEEIPDPVSVIECCIGLIKVDPRTELVTLAHYDISQEMREQWGTVFGEENTKRLARICIAYLKLDEFSNGPFHEHSAFRRDQCPFLHYASRFWGYHARAALRLTNPGAEISDDIHQFLEQPMNLGLSLQIAEYDLEDTQKSLTIDPDQFLGISSLRIASWHGLTKIFQDILKKNPQSISNQDWDARTALHETAKAGWEDVVRILIDADADSSSTDNVKKDADIISKQDLDGRTALHDAAKAGREDVVRILIDAGADPSQTDNEGKNPLFYAAERGHGKIILMLQDHHKGSDDDQKILEEALCEAVKADRPSVVKELLSIGVDPNTTTPKTSAITIASRKGRTAIARLLLKSGANPSCRDHSPSKHIPLHQAIRHGHVETAALLLDYDANLDIRDELGRTALSKHCPVMMMNLTSKQRPFYFQKASTSPVPTLTETQSCTKPRRREIL